MVFEPVMLLWVWLLGVPLIASIIELSRVRRHATGDVSMKDRAPRYTDRDRDRMATTTGGPITVR